MHRSVGCVIAAAVLAGVLFGPASASAAGGGNMLTNPGFDANGGSFDGWNAFNNAFISEPDEVSRSAPASGKMFGFAPPAVIFQSFPAAAGETYFMTGWSHVRSADPLPPTSIPFGNFAVMKIVFFDAPAGGFEIGGRETIIAHGGSPQDVWMFNSVSATAPAGTQRVQAMFIFVQGLAGEAGAVFVDDAVFQQEQPADFDVNLLDNPNFDDMPWLSGWAAFGNAFASAPDEASLSPFVAGKMFGNFIGGSECGDCAEPDPKGLPGCSDLACQDIVCAMDPFCCDTAWDGICADEAIQFCDCSAILNVSGLFQALPSVEGETYHMTGWSHVRSADPIPPTPLPQGNWAVMKIAFFDAPAGGTEIGGAETLIADGFSPQDAWMFNSVSATAPAGTQRAEALLLFLQGELDGGAVFVDNLTLDLKAASSCVGDLDGDGAVGINDFLDVLAAWGPCGDPCPPSCAADLDDDCTVGINDFLLVLANWGPCPP